MSIAMVITKLFQITFHY